MTNGHTFYSLETHSLRKGGYVYGITPMHSPCLHRMHTAYNIPSHYGGKHGCKDEASKIPSFTWLAPLQRKSTSCRAMQTMRHAKL